MIVFNYMNSVTTTKSIKKYFLKPCKYAVFFFVGIVFLLAGCVKAPVAVENKSILPEVKIKWFTALPTVDSDREAVYEEVNRHIKEKINATIEYEIINFDQWKDKIPVLLMSGEPMDIVWHNWLFSYSADVSKGYYRPLDDLLGEFGGTLVRDIPAALLENQRIRGSIYAIPCCQVSTSGNVYVIKQEAIDRTGYDICGIKGLYDLEPFIKAIHEKLPELYPIEVRGGGLWNSLRLELGWEYVFSGRGAPLFVEFSDKSRTVKNMFATPEYRKLCETAYRWYYNGYINEKTINTISAKEDEAAGKYGVMIGGTVKYPGSSQADMEKAYGYECAEVITSKSYWEYTAGQASMLCIPAQSKNPERAMMIIDLLNDDTELANMLAYGFEEKHYSHAAGNTIDRIPDSGYNWDWQWSMLNTFKLYTEFSFPQNHNSLISETCENAVVSQLHGYTPDMDEFSTELEQCQAVWEELGLGLQTGIYDPDIYLPQFLNMLHAAGIEKMIEAVQRQVDEQLGTEKEFTSDR